MNFIKNIKIKNNMSCILEKRKNLIRLYDCFNKNQDKYTDVNIIVLKKRYTNGNEYFDITYNYSYSNKNPSKEGHPFINTIYASHSEGEIILVNSMTCIMIDYLLMDLEELSKYTGNTDPIVYKINIMHSLAKLWD
jgi:hypothetical protein